MRSTVRAILDTIDQCLAKGDTDSRDLADLLSAIRGPDAWGADAAGEKFDYTAPLRGAMFPRTQSGILFNHAVCQQMRPGECLPLTPLGSDSLRVDSPLIHYRSHISYAIRAVHNTD